MNKKNPTERAIITNYSSEWVDSYKRNNYQNVDPTVIIALSRVAPFSWDESAIADPATNASLIKIYNDVGTTGAANGYTFVLHDNSHNLALLSFVMIKEKSDILRTMMERKKDKFQMLLINAIDIFSVCCNEAARSENNTAQDEKEFFTKRENEILYWASVGKTYQEIAALLGLKTTTIKFHISNAVKKLGVVNARHAIRLGTELQLIKPLL